jgi:hypothetical protein
LAAAPDRDRHVDGDRPAVVAELHPDHAAIRSGSCRWSASNGLPIPSTRSRVSSSAIRGSLDFICKGNGTWPLAASRYSEVRGSWVARS